MSSPRKRKPAPTPERTTLDTLSRRALRLHKALIDAEKQRYEQEHGSVANPYQLLNLISNDPSFAWLRPLTSFIVELEERLDDEEPIAGSDVERFSGLMRQLLASPGDSPAFHPTYVRVLHADPELGVIHGEIMQSLPKRDDTGESLTSS